LGLTERFWPNDLAWAQLPALTAIAKHRQNLQAGTDVAMLWPTIDARRPGASKPWPKPHPGGQIDPASAVKATRAYRAPPRTPAAKSIKERPRLPGVIGCRSTRVAAEFALGSAKR